MRVDQLKDSNLQDMSVQGLGIQYAYRRSSESRAYDVVGQDYLVYAHGCHGFAFAVCDGVGQSFCGDLAAKFLGDRLVEKSEIIYRDILSHDDKALAEKLTAFLNDLKTEGQQLVESYPLPDGTPPLVRQALENSRIYGSETMFVYGYLENAAAAEGANRSRQIWLCWLGDTEVQVLTPESQRLVIGADWISSERWSTVRGVRGTKDVHVWRGSVEDVGRIVVYSDGLAGIADQLYGLVQQPDRLQAQIGQISEAPNSDDISLLDLDLTAGSGIPEPAVKPEAWLSREMLIALGIALLEIFFVVTVYLLLSPLRA